MSLVSQTPQFTASESAVIAINKIMV